MNNRNILILTLVMSAGLLLYLNLLMKANNIELADLPFAEKLHDHQHANLTREEILAHEVHAAGENARISDGGQVPHDFMVWSGKDSMNIYSLIDKSKNNLFLRIDDRYCGDCIDSIFIAFKRIPIDTTKTQIVVLGNFTSNAARKFHFQKINFTTHIYTCGRLPFPAESAISPYLFTLDPALKADRFFFPVKDVPEYIADFLKKI
jgi:hypothetical protein